MKELIDFLRARLDEDEQVARTAAREAGAAVWESSDLGDSIYTEDTGSPIVVGPYDYLDDALKAFLTTNDPARMLAEVETKRQIIRMHKPVPTGYAAEPRWEDRDSIQRVCPSCGVSDGWHDVVAPCPTLRALALPYADHKDYDPAWARTR